MRDYQLRLFCMVLRFGTCVDRPAWALSKPGSLPYPLIFIPLHLCLQVQPVSKILKNHAVLFSWALFSQPGQLASRYLCTVWVRDPGVQDWRTGLVQTSRHANLKWESCRIYIIFWNIVWELDVVLFCFMILSFPCSGHWTRFVTMKVCLARDWVRWPQILDWNKL